MHPWKIRLLGALEVEKPTGERISLSGKKSGELLAYLALSPHRPHLREKLLTVLWEDADVSSVRTRLRQEIHKLRAQLPSEGNQPPLLHITPEELQLQSGVQIDAARFLEACAEAKQETNWERRKQWYAEIRSLYRADLLGEYDALWIMAERARFSQLYEQALRDCAEAYRQHRDYVGAEEALQYLLAHNPLMEESHIALMSLYAEQGLPTRVQQQYQTLERTLRDGGIAATPGIDQLAESLRTSAVLQHTAALTLQPTSDPPSDTKALPLTVATPDSGNGHLRHLQSALPTSPLSHPRAFKRHFVLMSILLVILALSAGLWRHKQPLAPSSSSGSSSAVALERHKERWTFFYKPQPGEKADAEGDAIIRDDLAIYVTGQIKTEKEDTDILTLKLDWKGNLQWVRRYSSPEHDCDRAYSICLDGQGGVFVAGETYVPERPGAPGGWFETVLHYNKKGDRLSAVRSPVPMHNEGHRMQVSSDRQGGCYVGGTTLLDGKEAILLMRYDRSGNLLWKKSFCEGARATFGQLAVNSEGELYCCGSTQRGEGPDGVNLSWMVICLHPNGDLKWMHPRKDETSHGCNKAVQIALDPGENVLVAGVFDTGDISRGGQGTKLGYVKYSPDGTLLCHHVVPDSGPAVVLEGMSVNHLGSLVLGGTEARSDGNSDIILARYDQFGNLNQSWRYHQPPGYRSADLHAPLLLNGEETQIVGRLCEGNSARLGEESSILRAIYSPDGRLLQQSLFDLGPHLKTSAYGATQDLITGQTTLPNGQHALMVLRY